MAHSQILENKARAIGFYAFNRWALKNGLSIEQTLATIRNVFKRGVNHDRRQHPQ